MLQEIQYGGFHIISLMKDLPQEERKVRDGCLWGEGMKILEEIYTKRNI